MSRMSPDECVRCDGDGWIETFDGNGFPYGATDCPDCDGTGKLGLRIPPIERRDIHGHPAFSLDDPEPTTPQVEDDRVRGVAGEDQ